jgi:tetratricopeptide (TPR) repeat protein
MRKSIILILIFSYGFCGIVDNLLLEGNEAMISEEYNNAIQAYESILGLGYENSDLYYNLGNAYYRSHFIGQSIWAYMNALEIAPRDKDINHNLSVANARIIDRIEMPENFIFLHLYRLIKSYFTINEWFLFGSVLLIFQAIWFVGLRFGILKGKVPKMISYSLIFLVIISHVIALDSYFQKQRRHTAVVIANGVDAYSGPFYGNNAIVFRVNEGSIADISSNQKDWVEIILIDGKKGWVPMESIRPLK